MPEEDIRALYHRITVFALLGILLTGLVVGLSAALPQYGQAKARAEEALRFNVQLQALAVGQVLSHWQDVARQFTSRSQIRDRLEAYNAGRIDADALRAYTAPKLTDALDQAGDVVGISRLDAKGQPVVRLGTAIPPDLLMMPPDGGPIGKGPVELAGADHVLVAAPILNREGERVGTDVVAFRLTPLLAALQPPPAMGEQARVYLSHADAPRVLTAAAGAHTGVVTRAEADLDVVLEMDAPLERAELPGDRLALSAPVPGAPWRLMVVVPQDRLHAIGLSALVLPLISILAMVGIGTLATGQLLRPLTRRAVSHAAGLAAMAAEQELVLSNARDFVYRRAPDGTYTYVSPAVQRVTGFKPTEWLQSQSRFAPLAYPQTQGAAYGTYEIAQVHRDGRRLVLEVNEQPYTEQGRFGGVVGIARDISATVASEQALRRADTEWNTALDFFDDAVVMVDLEDRVLRANRAFYRMTGRTPEQQLGRELGTAMHPNGGVDTCPACIARRRRQDTQVSMEADDPHNPTRSPIDISVRAVRDASGAVVGMLETTHDLTRSRFTEQELLLAASVFESSHEAILITDPERCVLRANGAFARATGADPTMVVGQHVDGLCGLDNGSSVWQAIDEVGLYQGEASCRRANGEVFPIWKRIGAQRGPRGEVLHYIVAFTDITDKKISEQRINRLAYYDVLTKLPNRTLFNERLEHALDRVKRQRHQLAVLLLDLDRFKNINDSLGLQSGDSLLQEVGKRVRRCVRVDDTVARLGGDEFGVILEDIEGIREVENIASGLLEVLGRPASVQGHELYIGASIGISLYPEDGAASGALLQHADAAMFRAKERGRNTYEFYTPELTRITSERLRLESDLRRAIERDELVVYYQPQVSILEGGVIGAEALVRWQSPERGLVPPGAFIPLAEETGLIDAIGRHVLNVACAQVVAWQRQGLGRLRIAVNIAGHQILQGDIVATVGEVLQRSGLPARQLELEITEGFVMSRPGDGIETLNRLKAAGVTLAIDDFGTGYSSLSYLKRLPIDRLKIDRSFVRDIPHDRDDMAIASTIIAMARHLGLEVIAEGVEQEAQVDYLRKHHCDEYQGFFISPPLPADEFGQLLKRLNRKGTHSAIVDERR